MFPNIPRGFNLSRILSGISKSLNVANEVIPIYQKLSPMVKNARNAFSSLKEMTSKPQNNNKINNNINPNKKIINAKTNNPSFFQ